MTDHIGEIALLGPDDFLVYPRSVHIMRFQGIHPDTGNRWWRMTCGSRPSTEAMDEALTVDYESAALHDMALCRRCFPAAHPGRRPSDGR